MKICRRQKCQREFEPKSQKQVFCSGKCRTYYRREERPKILKEVVSNLEFLKPDPKFEAKMNMVLEKLDAVISFKAPTPEMFDSPKFSNSFKDDEPLSFERMRSEAKKPTYLQLLNGMANIHFADEKEEYAAKIYAADHLSQKQIDALINALRQKQ